MDKQTKMSVRKLPSRVQVEQTLKEKSGLSKPSTDSSSSIHFDSGIDYGYKSGELTENKSEKDIKKSWTSSEKEHSVNPQPHFDSGLESDFSPLPSETDIIYGESEKALKKDISTTKASELPTRFLWQDIYTQDQDGDTILHLVVVEARSDVIFPLIRQAPHPDFLDICNDLCQTPLHLAALTGKSNIVRRLVAAGATLDIQDHHGNTALHIAAKNGDLDSVLAILEPLTICEIKEAQCLYDLYPHPPDLSHLINMKNYNGQASVHLAAMGGFKKALECLCDHGANINDQEGKSGKTALHYAVENANLELVQILLGKPNINPSTRNYSGQTPLKVAWTLYKTIPQKTYVAIIELLRRSGKESPSSSEEENSSNEEEERG